MFYNLHTHFSAGDHEIFEIVNQYPWELGLPDSAGSAPADGSHQHYSIGIHPWHIKESRLESDLEIIASRLSDRRCVAIGECGLDKRIDIPMDIQVPVFEKQLLIAEKHRMPVILHCVAAYQEAIEMKKRLDISVPMIIHGFSKNEQVAQSLLENGFYLSFGKYLLRNPELEPVFKAMPNERFFLETDMVEESIRDVYNLAAKYKEMALEQIKSLVAANFRAVFGHIH